MSFALIRREKQLPDGSRVSSLKSAICYFASLIVVDIMSTQSMPPAVISKKRKDSRFAVARESLLKCHPSPLSLVPIVADPPPPLPEAKPSSGAKAEIGRRAKMEDTYSIQENFLDVCISLNGLECLFPLGMNPDDVDTLSTEDPVTPEYAPLFHRRNRERLHFYAVYDGHGGNEASEHCSQRMHENIREAWNNLPRHDRDCESSSESSSFREESTMNNICHFTTSADIVEMFDSAFKATDSEFKLQTEASAVSGTTALVALVGEHHIFLGYCGDSRAVICRKEKAFPLTVDHKPERDDETDRIQKAGGQVLFFNGPRVMGLLAMSRAIGDQSLRPYVVPDPDVCVIHRSEDDEILILASDGLWDVLSNQEACSIALRCLKRAKQKGAKSAEAARLTATVLTRAAMDRGSRDNITVVIVDLTTTKDSFVQPVSSLENDHMVD